MSYCTLTLIHSIDPIIYNYIDRGQFHISYICMYNTVYIERTCKECNSGEVEDVIHCLLRCPTWNSQRQPLMKMIQPSQDDAITTARILTQACHSPIDFPVVYYVESKIWTHVTIVMYVSLCNSNVSAHEKQ